MTITEANAVNELLDWIISGKNFIGEKIDDELAKADAKILARSANKVLSAGLSPTEIDKRWARRRLRSK